MGIANDTVLWVCALCARVRAFVTLMVSYVIVVGVDALPDACPIHRVAKQPIGALLHALPCWLICECVIEWAWAYGYTLLAV